MADPITQAKHTARVLIGEARARRLAGHGFWCMFRMAQSTRRRADFAQTVSVDRSASRRPQLELFV